MPMAQTTRACAADRFADVWMCFLHLDINWLLKCDEVFLAFWGVCLMNEVAMPYWNQGRSRAYSHRILIKQRPKSFGLQVPVVKNTGGTDI